MPCSKYYYHGLTVTNRQDLEESARLGGGEFLAWLTVQYWLMKQGKPSALAGGQNGEPALP